MTTFADKLFDDLMRDHGTALDAVEQPAPPGRRASRPLWLTAGTLAAVGATTGGLVLAGGGSAAAYAVTQNADGTATIAINRLSGIDGANTRLRVLGDRVVVVPVRPGCPSIDSLPPPRVKPTGLVTGRARGNAESTTIDVRGIPDGDTALVAVLESHGAIMLVMRLISGDAPSCVSLTKARVPGAGDGSGRSGSQSGH
jgi:hypothetical protein